MYEKPFHDIPLAGKRILVTGGAGFIGSNLVEYFVKHGAGLVRVLDNLSTGNLDNIRPFLREPNVEFIEADIRDATACEQACRGIHWVSHQAALGSVPRSMEDPVTTNEVNVGGCVNMLEAARKNGVERFVYASSSSVYGDDPSLPKVESRTGNALSPYAVSKQANELYASVFARAFGMRVTGLRYFNIFGPRQDPSGPYAAVIPLFIDAMASGRAPHIHGDGQQSRDFTFVENAVQANVRALATEHVPGLARIYNIAAGGRYSIIDLFGELKELTGYDGEPIWDPPREGDIRDSQADISKAAKEINYHPLIDFHNGLKQTVAYFQTKGTER